MQNASRREEFYCSRVMYLTNNHGGTRESRAIHRERGKKKCLQRLAAKRWGAGLAVSASGPGLGKGTASLHLKETFTVALMKVPGGKSSADEAAIVPAELQYNYAREAIHSCQLGFPSFQADLGICNWAGGLFNRGGTGAFSDKRAMGNAASGPYGEISS